jgi:hypothetical protein
MRLANGQPGGKLRQLASPNGHVGRAFETELRAPARDSEDDDFDIGTDADRFSEFALQYQHDESSCNLSTTLSGSACEAPRWR